MLHRPLTRLSTYSVGTLSQYQLSDERHTYCVYYNNVLRLRIRTFVGSGSEILLLEMDLDLTYHREVFGGTPTLTMHHRWAP